MKQLTLIRHAKSSWDEIGLADIDRPLNARGRRDAPEMGRRLKALGFVPDVVLVSSAKRTQQTALALWIALGIEPRSRIEPALYMAGTTAMLELIEATSAAVSHLVLIGHNPGLTALAKRLGATSIENIPTAGMVRFHVDAERWSALDFERIEWIDFDYPKRVRPR